MGSDYLIVPGPKVIKLFSCSTPLSMSILTFVSRQNCILGFPEPEKC